MSSPLVAQGTLNRLRGSVVIPFFPALTITAPYLGNEGINMSLEGDIVDILPTMTGIVTSPAPYQMCTVEVELLKTQSFSNQYKSQLEDNAVIGTFIIRPDASTLGVYTIFNGSITNAQPGRLNGKSVGFMVTLKGYYNTNESLYSAS